VEQSNDYEDEEFDADDEEVAASTGGKKTEQVVLGVVDFSSPAKPKKSPAKGASPNALLRQSPVTVPGDGGGGREVLKEKSPNRDNRGRGAGMNVTAPLPGGLPGAAVKPRKPRKGRGGGNNRTKKMMSATSGAAATASTQSADVLPVTLMYSMADLGARIAIYSFR
jgi:hypothetical protein